MAVGAGGSLVVSGVCPAAAHEAGCMPTGVHRRQRSSRDSGPDVQLVQAATPSLVRTAYALSFSMDGRTLFAVGRRWKSDSLAVFVSHDAGATFEARDVGGGFGQRTPTYPEYCALMIAAKSLFIVCRFLCRLR